VALDCAPQHSTVQVQPIGYKRGDTYLRNLLIHGANSLIFRAPAKGRQQEVVWLKSWIPKRRNKNWRRCPANK
jgi:hypothetical protein